MDKEQFEKYVKMVKRLNSQVDRLICASDEISKKQLQSNDNLYEAFMALSNMIYDNFEMFRDDYDLKSKVISEIANELGVTEEKINDSLFSTDEDISKLDQKVNHYIQKKYIQYLQKASAIPVTEDAET